MGARAYTVVEQFSDVMEGECVLEIGSERGEGSSRYLAEFCARHDATFHTVDIDPVISEATGRLLGGLPKCYVHLGAGEEFLANSLAERVRFAYLDNFDCIPHEVRNEPFIEYHRQRYRELGLEMTNKNSEAAHLQQAVLVHERSASRCAILVDDTFMRRRRWFGKGATAMPYLRSVGYLVRDIGGAGLAVRT